MRLWINLGYGICLQWLRRRNWRAAEVREVRDLVFEELRYTCGGENCGFGMWRDPTVQEGSKDL